MNYNDKKLIEADDKNCPLGPPKTMRSGMNNMKREELKAYRPYANRDGFYHKSEADSVMDAYEQRIKELEAKLKETDEVMDSCRGLIESASVMSKSAEDNLFNRIKKLEAENARLKEQTPKWISASERMPKQNETDDDDNVWVYNRSGVYKQNYENVRVSDMWMRATIPSPPVTEKSSETERR